MVTVTQWSYSTPHFFVIMQLHLEHTWRHFWGRWWWCSQSEGVKEVLAGEYDVWEEGME